MRYPDGHKESVRARIVEKASRALRRGGLGQVSVPALMKEAGLTHGGFYNHFEGKDELVAEAVRFAAKETGEREFGDARTLEQMLAGYLSEEHVAHPEGGCVVAALGTEAAHQAPSVRRTFAWAARGLIDRVQRKLHPKSAEGTLGDDALALASQMVGAVVLARLVEDDALSARLLSAARRRR
jgi:TetR/AcrR family transcriptional repressor of nem operon